MFKQLKNLGPGLLFAGAAIGVSHLIQSTKAGAEFGFGLLWALVLVHLFKYPFFQFGTRYAAATKESLLDGYYKLGKGVLLTYFILNTATMFTIQAAVTIVTAGLAANLFGLTDNLAVWSFIVTAIAFLILTIGKYKLLDQLMKYIIITLTITTLIAVVIAFAKNTNQIVLQQILPSGAVEISFLIAFLGWMPGPLDISIWQSLWNLEKSKKTKTSVKQALFDFNIGYFSTLFIGICFVALGALVMYNSGEIFKNGAIGFSQQLIQMYTKNLGSGTYLIIGFAALTTMFSTTITTLDASPRSMEKTINLLSKKEKKNGYWFWIVTLSLGTLTILFYYQSQMVFLVQVATVLSFLSAPFYAITNLILISGKNTPEEARPSFGLKVLSWCGILFLFGFSIWYLLSIL